MSAFKKQLWNAHTVHTLNESTMSKTKGGKQEKEVKSVRRQGERELREIRTEIGYMINCCYNTYFDFERRKLCVFQFVIGLCLQRVGSGAALESFLFHLKLFWR